MPLASKPTSTAATPPVLTHALQAVAPALSAPDLAAWIEALSTSLNAASIITPRRVAAFLGQCAEESGGFRMLEENLAYSAARLCVVWPNRFPTVQAAAPYAFHPEALANQVYADRMGNGDVASGDGWRFRGRGLIQLTGRAAYARYARARGRTTEAVVESLATMPGAADCAAWFWNLNRLNQLADSWALDTITRRINGGLTGAPERARLCNAALRAITG